MSVTLQNFSIAYGDFYAVKDLSCTFPAGATGLLGVNGAGKSSLIKGLLGLVTPQSGSARILDKDITAEKKRICQLIGYMPEDDCLIPGLSGLSMVQYAGELCGMRRDDAIQRAHDVLFLVGLEEARYRKVETYSSGMKQRIKLAQALVHDPQLLFLDEPTSGMDPKGRQEMLDLVQLIVRNGNMNVILASHILVDVERTCDRVLILHEGKIVEQGEMDTLRGAYGGAFQVRIEGDLKSFQKALEKQRCVIQSTDRQLMDISLPDGADANLLLQIADESGVQLRKLVPSIQTLEDVFLKRIGGNADADL